MPLLFFHLYEGALFLEDEEGQFVRDVGAAREAALRAAREVMCSEVAEGRLCLDCRLEIVAEDGQTVLTVPFREAVEISGA